MIVRRLIEVGSFLSWFRYGCHHGGGISGKTGLPHNFPCGRCASCRKQKSKEWIVRLYEENKHCASSYFFTLTYDDFFLPTVEPYEYEVYSHDWKKIDTFTAEPNEWQVGIDVVCKRDVQLFMKRLRRKLAKQSISVRHFIVSEYGPQTLRPHYHGILFFDKYMSEIEFHRFIQDAWTDPRSHVGIGNIETSIITNGRMMYVAKYATGITDLPEHLQVKKYKPFMLSSRRRGIGYQYIDDRRNYEFHRKTHDRTYTIKVHPSVPVGGEMLLNNSMKSKSFVYPLPKYYFYNMIPQDIRYRMELETLDEKHRKFKEKIEEYEVVSHEQFGIDNKYYLSMIEDAKQRIKTKNMKRKNI